MFALAVAGATTSGGPQIVWDAPAGCPAASELEAHVDAYLRHRKAVASDGPIVATTRRIDDDRWELVVTFSDRDAERRLELTDCAASAQAAAFVIAITLDPELDSTTVARPAADAVPLPHAPTTTPVPPTTPAPARVPGPARKATPGAAPRTSPNKTRTRGFVQVGAAVLAGMLRPASPGLVASAGPMWPRARLWLGYTRWFRGRTYLPELPKAGGDVSVHTFSVAAGPVFTWRTLELPIRAGGEFGALSATGFGTDRDHERRSAWAVLTVGSGLQWAPRFLRGYGAFVAYADAAFALVRPRVVIDEHDLLAVGVAAFRGGAFLEARFP